MCRSAKRRWWLPACVRARISFAQFWQSLPQAKMNFFFFFTSGQNVRERRSPEFTWQWESGQLRDRRIYTRFRTSSLLVWMTKQIFCPCVGITKPRQVFVTQSNMFNVNSSPSRKQHVRSIIIQLTRRHLVCEFGLYEDECKCKPAVQMYHGLCNAPPINSTELAWPLRSYGNFKGNS